MKYTGCKKIAAGREPHGVLGQVFPALTRGDIVHTANKAKKCTDGHWRLHNISHTGQAAGIRIFSSQEEKFSAVQAEKKSDNYSGTTSTLPKNIVVRI